MNIKKYYYYLVYKIENQFHFHFFKSHVFLRAAYFFSIGHELHVKKPIAFTEKIQWMKLYDHNQKYIKITDKLGLRDYVRTCIGERYNVPIIGVWNSSKEIPIDSLPSKVVFKCTHDCGSFIVYSRYKDNWQKIRKHLDNCLKHNYYYVGREWAYKDIYPRIIAEPYLVDSNGELLDYKFFCFNGKVKFFKIDFDRFECHKANYYDAEGNYLDFGELDYPRDSKRKVTIPQELTQMIKIAEKLSEGFLFLRVDLF